MARQFEDILANARGELRERRDEIAGDESHDVIHEIADSFVPVYYTDIFAVLAELPCWELSDPGIAEGVTDISQLAQIHIYDAISQDLFESWDDIVRESDDDGDDED